MKITSQHSFATASYTQAHDLTSRYDPVKTKSLPLLGMARNLTKPYCSQLIDVACKIRDPGHSARYKYILRPAQGLLFSPDLIPSGIKSGICLVSALTSGQLNLVLWCITLPSSHSAVVVWTTLSHPLSSSLDHYSRTAKINAHLPVKVPCATQGAAGGWSSRVSLTLFWNLLGENRRVSFLSTWPSWLYFTRLL